MTEFINCSCPPVQETWPIERERDREEIERDREEIRVSGQPSNGSWFLPPLSLCIKPWFIDYNHRFYKPKIHHGTFAPLII